MSVVDIASSIANFVGPWAANEDKARELGLPPLLFGSDKGTQATCSAQGFFLQLGLAAPLYNVSQVVYSRLVGSQVPMESESFQHHHSCRQQTSLASTHCTLVALVSTSPIFLFDGACCVALGFVQFESGHIHLLDRSLSTQLPLCLGMRRCNGSHAFAATMPFSINSPLKSCRSGSHCPP